MESKTVYSPAWLLRTYLGIKQVKKWLVNEIDFYAKLVGDECSSIAKVVLKTAPSAKRDPKAVQLHDRLVKEVGLYAKLVGSESCSVVEAVFTPTEGNAAVLCALHYHLLPDPKYFVFDDLTCKLGEWRVRCEKSAHYENGYYLTAYSRDGKRITIDDFHYGCNGIQHAKIKLVWPLTFKQLFPKENMRARRLIRRRARAAFKFTYTNELFVEMTRQYDKETSVALIGEIVECVVNGKQISPDSITEELYDSLDMLADLGVNGQSTLYIRLKHRLEMINQGDKVTIWWLPGQVVKCVLNEEPILPSNIIDGLYTIRRSFKELGVDGESKLDIKLRHILFWC